MSVSLHMPKKSKQDEEAKERSLYKKTYLRRIRRNWIISFNLIEERSNQ